jgi:hypothetical protein
MKHLILTLLLIALTVLSVSVSLAQGNKKSDAPNKQAPKKAEDTWERQRECLKLAEADIARTTPLYNSDNVFFWMWSAHYSPKYGHCYVRIESDNKGYKEEGPRTFVSTVLRDALENTFLASTMEQGAADKLGLHCHVPGKKETPCAESEAFITDHMTN